MNEAENFYDNASKIGGRLSSIQQREEEGREASVDIARTKWDTLLGQDQNAEGKEEGEGGAETSGGLTTSLLVAGAKKVISGRVKSALRNVVQKKVDQIKQNKADSNVETKDPAPDDAPARSPADLDIQNGQSIADSRSQASNLSDRMNNMDSASKQSVMDEYNSDPAKISNPSTPADYENNVRTMEGKVKAQEQNPETKFQDENLGSEADGGADATASVGNTTTTQVAQQAPRTQAQDDAQLGGDTDATAGGASNTPVSSTQVQSGSTNTGANTGNQVVDDSLDSVSDTAGNISQKGMDVLTDKLGVDFGDLAPADIGAELGSAVGEASGSMLGAIGGAVGTALDFLGPIGMLIGLGTTIFGLSEDAKTESDSSAKQSQIETLAGSVNDMGGMSMGSIASTPMDTAQIRGGGASLNF